MFDILVNERGCTNTGSRLQRVYKQVLIVTILFSIANNDADAKKSARSSQVLVVTELVVSRTQCKFCRKFLSQTEEPEGDCSCFCCCSALWHGGITCIICR